MCAITVPSVCTLVLFIIIFMLYLNRVRCDELRPRPPESKNFDRDVASAAAVPQPWYELLPLRIELIARLKQGGAESWRPTSLFKLVGPWPDWP